jgi:hypothetical protein
MAATLVTLVLSLSLSAPVFAQSSGLTQASTVPRLITLTGIYHPADGQPLAPLEPLTLAVYAEESGGTPLWEETQQVVVDATGRYTVLLGASLPDGIPLEVFASGEAQWLGTTFHRSGDVEGARMRITSVPYALHAGDAATLGGRPVSDFALAPTTNGLATPGSHTTTSKTSSLATTTSAATTTSLTVLPGIANALTKYVDADNVGASAVSEVSGRLGINTGAALPFDYLHVRFTDPFGAFTGIAVQNLSNNANAASGMLFYDHNGALTQFQGFNNTNHGYVINNIAKNGANQFDGSYNFLLGSASRLFVASSGNIGLGTTAPSAPLEVSNAVSSGTANVWITDFTNFVGPYYMARRSRGTPGAPTAAQNGDALAGFYGEGYGATAFGGGFAGGMTIQAAQNFTDTAHGTHLVFTTTPVGSITSATRMTLDATGNLGVGTTTTPAVGQLEASNAANPGLGLAGTIAATTYSNTQNSLVIGRRARGTVGAPTAVLGGDALAGFLAQGHNGTGFSGTRGGMLVRAAENWTGTAQGTSLAFNTTVNGTTTPSTKVTITPDGNVGIGTTTPFAPLEIVQNGEANVISTSYNDGDASAMFLRRARGTSQAPTAVHAGDSLGYLGAAGYGATGWGNGAGAMVVVAAETWTDSANGSLIGFATTPIGTTDFVARAVILANGNVGIGTALDVNGIPTAVDKLQVGGDIRVGTDGTTNLGCVKNFSGTGIAGTCSSDRRLKRDITSFGPVLNQLTALQPVHYFWRAAEFPDRHFGNGQNYGLIAQDVEQVLPELVVTNADGYKAVDYTKLPLLTIQAVKELKTENDALKERVTELERLINALLPTRTRDQHP